MKDFFISYSSADKAWAEWIAWILEEGGYSVVIQAWDFRPGRNFVLEMQRAAAETQRTIAVLSQDYLKSEYTQPEWAAAFQRDPRGRDRRLIPVRVKECVPTGLLSAVTYINVIGFSEQDARIAILGGLGERAKPVAAPAFPGGCGESSRPARERIVPNPAQYPGNSNADNITDSIIATEPGAAISDASIRPHLISTSDEPLSVTDRLLFVQELNSLPAQEFNIIIYAIDPPAGLIPPMPVAQADRTVALLSWAESPDGCGLPVIQRILDQITRPMVKRRTKSRRFTLAGIFILIVAGVVTAVSIRPTRTVELLVRSEPASSVFVDGVFKAETGSDGTFKAEIPTGSHTITLQNDCFGKYEQEAQFRYGKPVQVIQTATPKTQAEFKMDEFKDTSRWDAPESWEIRKDNESNPDGRLYVENSWMKLGLARGAYFRDFKAVFQIKLVNDLGAAWALRARDQNYYLFYLSRPPGGSEKSFTLQCFIVIENQIDHSASRDFPPQKVPLRLTSSDEYTVVIEAKGNTIKHIFIPAETGDPTEIGLFTDNDNRFVCGGIGFLTLGEERFSIDDFEVIPPNLKLYEE